MANQAEHIEAVEGFLAAVKAKHGRGNATEHSYRADLEKLFLAIDGEVKPINEARRIACGSPDFTFLKKEIPMGYLEAKDVGRSIKNFTIKSEQEQFVRYKGDLENLIYTNCLDWDFYREGTKRHSISIGEIKGNRIEFFPDKFDKFIDFLTEFLIQETQGIKSADDLAKRMAQKTRMIKHAIENGLNRGELPELDEQRDAIDKILVKDISVEDFVDMYAQTITYGLFVARYHANESGIKFSRQDVGRILPTTYPFLRRLFKFIASDELENTIDWAIDDLVELYYASDLELVTSWHSYGTGRDDPFIHFYEEFLAAYDSKKRKSAGVYYTPRPVVEFIVRSVNDVLQDEFGLKGGLANTEKTEIEWRKQKEEVHRVQILDPATGTGAFLEEVINVVAKEVKSNAAGAWSQYVDKELLPRLHGFEFMMAPYAMAYLKLGITLGTLGYEPTTDRPKRMRIFLTNSLAGAPDNIPTLGFTGWLSDEAKGARETKNKSPIMCVIGNPPYLGESGNKDPWIMDLMEDYKQEPDNAGRLQERNPKWINDDYVKFIRMAQHMVDKNGEGVVGMITNHGYLDNPTFRGMRWQLMNSFDKIYVLDLHGNSRKKERSPDGSRDVNVFDIQTGVSIIIAWKTKPTSNKDKPLAKVYHGELWGERDDKFKALEKTGLKSRLFKRLKPIKPNYFFYRRDSDSLNKYNEGFKITEFMPANSVGILTARDNFTIDTKKNILRNRVKDFIELDIEEARQKYSLGVDTRDWKVKLAQKDIENSINKDKLQKIYYRPFDTRWTYYTGKSKGFMSYPRNEIMKHFIDEENLGLTIGRQGQVVGSMPWNLIFIQNQISDINMFYRGGGMVFPLYLYSDPEDLKGQCGMALEGERRVNMDDKIRAEIEKLAKHRTRGLPDEVNIFDYIYATLHAPSYRERYQEFLKTDFPRIPYPASAKTFWALAREGQRLRALHLMTASDLDTKPYEFIGDGDNKVDKIKYNNKKVFINERKSFENIPTAAWEFYIGGYQPAQKWLKDRKGQVLDFTDINHYQKIIATLLETQEVMQRIDKILDT